MSAPSMMNATLTFTWYSVILPPLITAELFTTSRPVMCRSVCEARLTACWAASLQLLSDTPTNSITRTTAGGFPCSAVLAMFIFSSKTVLPFGRHRLLVLEPCPREQIGCQRRFPEERSQCLKDRIECPEDQT